MAPANRSRPDPSGEDRLLAASRDLEGVFMHHLVKAMRATVPNGGRPDAPGSDVYGAMLDDHLAQVVARDTSSGIAEAIYRQLTGRTHDPTPKVE